MATIGAQTNTRDAGEIPLKGLRHRSLNITDVDNNDVLTSAANAQIPLGVQLALWEAGTTTEPCSATGTFSAEISTVAFATDGSTSYDGTLHLWYNGNG